MHRRHIIQSVAFTFSVIVGICCTSIANLAADWFVDKYLSDPWIDPLPDISSQRNCDPLVLVLNRYGEVYSGKEVLGKFIDGLGHFEEQTALNVKLTEKILIFKEQHRLCIAFDTRPCCLPPLVFVLIGEGADPKVVASFARLLRGGDLALAQFVVRHRFRKVPNIEWSAIQSTKSFFRIPGITR